MTLTAVTKKTLGVIFILALISNSLWLFEITKRVGWQGDMWLQKDLFSPIVIAILAALAFVTPFWMSYRKIDGRIVLTTLTFCMINLSTYFLTSMILRGAYFQPNAFLHFLKIIVLALFIGGYFYVTDQLIMPLNKKNIGLFGISAVAIIVFSWVSVFLFKGFGIGTSFLDAFKMGYPFFWLCVLLGASGIFLVQQYKEKE